MSIISQFTTYVNNDKIVADYFSLVDTETHFDYFNPQLTGIDAHAREEILLRYMESGVDVSSCIKKYNL